MMENRDNVILGNKSKVVNFGDWSGIMTGDRSKVITVDRSVTVNAERRNAFVR